MARRAASRGVGVAFDVLAGGFQGGGIVAGHADHRRGGVEGGVGTWGKAGNQGAGRVDLAQTQQYAGLQGGQGGRAVYRGEGGEVVERIARPACRQFALGSGEGLTRGFGVGGQFDRTEVLDLGVMDGPGDGVEGAHGYSCRGTADTGLNGLAGFDA